MGTSSATRSTADAAWPPFHRWMGTSTLDASFMSRVRRLAAGLGCGGPALPGVFLTDLHDLHRRDLVLGAVRRPVRVLRRDDVRARLREVERRVDDARMNLL